MGKVNLTIDQQDVAVEAGSTILEAAQTINIRIPTLCYLDLGKLKMVNKVASCRVCEVEVAGRENLAPACATPVFDGMQVTTNSRRVLRARRKILELLLSDHPFNCLICAKAKDCELQTLAYEFGINAGLAFQLKDDLLDVFGTVDKFGKMPGGDILSDKKTFLLIKALAIADEADRKTIENYIGEGEEDPEQKIMDITTIYARLNLDKITLTEMERHFERAEYHLEKVNLPEEKKAELLEIAKKMMYREN